MLKGLGKGGVGSKEKNVVLVSDAEGTGKGVGSKERECCVGTSK